jgi:hypothetical protein
VWRLNDDLTLNENYKGRKKIYPDQLVKLGSFRNIQCSQRKSATPYLPNSKTLNPGQLFVSDIL